MRLGITGTRHGATDPQRVALARLLIDLHPTEFHHGACRGVDGLGVQLVHPRRWATRIIAHPGVSAGGSDNEWLDAEAVRLSDEVRPTKSHFARNRDIVDECDGLIVVPFDAGPITKATRGGTAMTCNHARKRGKPIWIVLPDGTVERENEVTP